LVRFIEILATIGLWWHPIVWLARRGLRNSEETCCDAWVIATLPGARRSYASAIVDTLETCSAAPCACACGIGRIGGLQRRIQMIFTHTPPKALSRFAKVICCAFLLILPVVPVRGADQSSDEKDKRIAQLEERVRQLEAKLAAVEKNDAADSATSLQASKATREQLVIKARARMRQDRTKHSAKELEECEELYQVANKNWRTPQAKESLQKMLEKYPDVNRTGCALVYMGQMSTDEDKEKYLKEAIDKHSDCWYGNGVQVGPWARMLLAWHDQENNKPEEAKKLFDESRKDYPNSIDHSGNLLVKVIAKQSAASQPSQ
jgi:hypothetical protein